MLQITKTYVAESKIAGKGLFAGELIPKGTIIWRFNVADKVITPVEFMSLDVISRAYVKNFCYVDEQHNYVLCSDDAKYMNHSDFANTENGEEDQTTIAIEDIQSGEEITCNYFEFDYDVEFKLNL